MPPTLAVMPGAMVSTSSSKLGGTLSVRSWMDRSAPPARGVAGCVVHARARAPPVPMEPTEAISEVAGKPAVIAAQRATLTPTHMSSTAAVLELLRVLVINTEIAQLNLELDHLSLGMRRMVGDSTDGGRVAVVPENKGMAHLHLPAVPPPPPSASWRAPGTRAGDNDDGDSGEFSSLDEDDETLVHCLATKVGVFRRGRYAGGRRVGKDAAASLGDLVKEGQVVGFIEQLGTFVEVKAVQEGEVVAFHLEEGAMVEYSQPLVAIAPAFGVKEAGVTEVR